MWILNQKRTSIARINYVCKSLKNNEIIVASEDGAELVFGKFDTEQRAKEVVDEIWIDIKHGSTFYEMPDE